MWTPSNSSSRKRTSHLIKQLTHAEHRKLQRSSGQKYLTHHENLLRYVPSIDVSCHRSLPNSTLAVDQACMKVVASLPHHMSHLQESRLFLSSMLWVAVTIVHPTKAQLTCNTTVSTLPLMASTKLSPSSTPEPAPTVEIHMSSLNGQAMVETLPDSGADICVSRPTLLNQLNEHKDNLLSFNVTTRAINDTAMDPLGKVPITLTLRTHRHTDTFHIYPASMQEWYHGKPPKHFQFSQRTTHHSRLQSPPLVMNQPQTLHHSLQSPPLMTNQCPPRHPARISDCLQWTDQNHEQREVPHHFDQRCQTILCQHPENSAICLLGQA